MTRDELRALVKNGTYFQDGEGKLRIKQVYKDTFLAEDPKGEIYELFFVDYESNRQPFTIT